MTAIETIVKIQELLREHFPEVEADGDIGKRTLAAIRALDEMGDIESAQTAPIPSEDVHTVLASSFADLADVRAFRKCKEAGGSDQHCFSKGDNGIGAWGRLTAQEDIPMVALPREIWRHAGKTGGDKVLITYQGKKLLTILGDTMPSLDNIKNGAGMDTNPAVAKAFGLKPPYMVTMTWQWA